MRKTLYALISFLLLLMISVAAQETWNSYIIAFEDTFINVIDFLFGSTEFSISFLKFAAWVILFSFLTKGFERIFSYHKLVAVISSLLISVIGIRLIPEYYFEISTPLIMWFAIGTILIGAPYALLTVVRIRGRLKNFLWFVAVIIEIFYIGQLGDLGYAFRNPVFYNLTYVFGKYWELILIGLIVVGVGFLAGRGNRSVGGPVRERPEAPPRIESQKEGMGWGKALAAALGIDFLRDFLTKREKREQVVNLLRRGKEMVGEPITKDWKETRRLWSMQCNSCGAPLNRGSKCNRCGTPYPWRDRWRYSKKAEEQEKAIKRLEERISLLDRSIEDAYWLVKKNPEKYSDVKRKIERLERERKQTERSLRALLGD